MTNTDAERVSDIVVRLRELLNDDHGRGCQGREYTCTCGYDVRWGNALGEAADIIEAQSKALAEARAEIAETKRILEGCLAVAVKGDPLDAPFPMEPHQAVIWHQARTEAFRHALEMMPSTPTPENPNG